jgi:hypothetical protein
MPENTASGLVFDYRLTMPAYLEAIAIRLTILVSSVKNYRQVARAELVNMAATLEGYVRRIRDRISLVLGVPSYIWDTDELNDVGGFMSAPMWMRLGAAVGAVEIYSAFDRAEPWAAHEFPRANRPKTGDEDRPEFHVLWRQFLVRWSIRSWVRWKEVYHAVGLAAAEAAIVKIKQMAGVVPAAIAGPGGSLSMRELAHWFNQTDADDWGSWDLVDLRHPISLRRMLEPVLTGSPSGDTSLRAALAQ